LPEKWFILLLAIGIVTRSAIWTIVVIRTRREDLPKIARAMRRFTK